MRMIPHHVAPADWPGETAVLVASGPSTEQVDLSLLEGHRVIAVAHGYRAAPDADVLVVGGRAFYYVNDLKAFRGDLIIAAQHFPSWSWLRQRDSRLVYMYRAGKLGLTDDRGSLAGSESSVMLAINYAVHRGVNRIVLLGCDARPSDDGRRRVGIAEPDSNNARHRYRVQEHAMRSQLAPLAALGIKIVNCSPGTALRIYPTAALEDVLGSPARQAQT